MRVAVVTQSLDRVGGVETYLEAVLPALAMRHEVALCVANAHVTNRGAIRLPRHVSLLEVGRAGSNDVNALRAWSPDLIFAHGLEDAALERAVLDSAPAVAVEHTYHGTCISSAKTMTWPAVEPCEREFGPACMALYFPRRCGGSNPLTMASLYRAQSARLTTLRNAAAIVTLSHHMASEMTRNGVRADRVHVVPPFVSPVAHSSCVASRVADHTRCRLLYLGRLERLKGVEGLLKALGPVATRLKRPVHLTIAGDGSERVSLEALASDIRTNYPAVSIEFAGWQDDEGRARLFTNADALVVPSIWPEPFGLVGLEAAAAGVPAVAFPDGGIPEWLHEGENGCLASVGTDRVVALTEAIVRCVHSVGRLSHLRDGARKSAARWGLDEHVRKLEQVFETVVPSLCASGAV
jgi:glycosyltransferase involved in cell wall biosynthesis